MSYFNPGMIINLVNKLARPFGVNVKVEKTNFPFDIKGNEAFMQLYEKVRPFSMTSLERMYGLYEAMNYIIKNRIPGDFVECGVWKGGSAMMIALMLGKSGIRDRQLHLYDTFEGMSEPTEEDKTAKGKDAAAMMSAGNTDKGAADSIWCYSPIDEVKENLASTGYPVSNVHYVKGKVEDTLAANLPGRLALLRLDTDWYASTKVELELLFPLLTEKGILIIDDFGHWEGAKKAVVEYFEKENLHPLFQRLDYTGRLLIK